MASKKSCSEPAGLFCPALLRRWLLRSWPCWGVTLLLGMLLLPVHLGTELSSSLRAGIRLSTVEVSAWVCRLGYVALGATMVLGLVTAILVSRQLFTARAANFFHSLPIRREGLFLTGVAAGLAMLWLPVLPAAAAAAVVEAVFGVFHAQSLLWLLLFWLCSSLLCFGMGMLCCQLAGMTASAVGLYAAANLWVLALYAVLSQLLGTLLVGYAGVSTSESAVQLLTPVWSLAGAVSSAASLVTAETPAPNAMLQTLGMPGLYALAGLALLAVALLFARVRQSERAGDLLAFGWMRPVFKVVMAVGLGAAMGLVTLIFYGVDSPGFLAVLLPTLGWSLLAWLGAEMLVRKSVHIFQRKVFLRWGILALLLAAVLGGVRLDLLGVERRVPAADEVASVRVSYAGRFADMDDPADAIGLHQMLVAHRDELRRLDADNTTSLQLSYTLRDGSQLDRLYYIPTSSLREMDELQRSVYDFVTDPDFTLLLAIDGPLSRDELKDVNVEWFDAAQETYIQPELTEAEKWTLYQALEADIRAGAYDYGDYLCTDAWSSGTSVNVYILYKHRTESEQRRADGPAAWEKVHWTGFGIEPDMTHTLEALRALGWREDGSTE